VKTSVSPPTVTRFGVFELDLRSRELHKQGIRVKLQGQPVEILVLLLERPGEAITREELQKRLWPADTFVDFEQGLNNAMKRLRAALDDNAETPRFIETLPRRGYRFIGSVNSAGHEESMSKTTGEGARPTRMGRDGSARLLWLTVGLGVVLAGVLLSMSNHQSPTPKITAITQLTSDGREKDLPIATDGLRVYFSELVDGHWTVAAVPTSGGQTIPIRTPLKDVVFMNLSPDRSDLLVGEGGPIAEMPLWRVPILGGPPRRLGDMLAHDANWSPDGKKLVYANAGVLYVAESDGTRPRELVRASADPSIWAWRPHWSPDGSHIRFTLYHMGKHLAALREVTADGKDLHQVLPGWQTPPMHTGFSWTSDGRYYLFSAWKGLLGGNLSRSGHLGRIAKRSASSASPTLYPSSSPLDRCTSLAWFPVWTAKLYSRGA
jgi:DNA-binding winged helix-turn-helix (wHTH) protein